MLTDVCDLRSVEECTLDAGIMTAKVCGPVRSKVTCFVEHNEPVFTQVVL